MEEILQSIDCRDANMLHVIFDRHYRQLCFYASRYLKDDELIKDVVQEAFIKGWERGLSFPNDYALKAYLYSTVCHSCLDKLKLQNIHDRHHRIILDNAEKANLYQDPDFVNRRIESEVFTEIFRAIDQLPSECSRIFKLSYLEGKSIQEISDELSISVNTIKTQRSRAKKILQSKLGHLYAVVLYFFINNV